MIELRAMVRRRHLAAIALLVLSLTACGGTDDPGSEGTSTTITDELEGTVTVLGAASLTDALAEVAEAFQAVHGGVEVELTFGGSSRLATSIVEGVPADVFASADEANLQKVVDEGLAGGTATVFATNVMQIVVGEGNPLGITGLEDLTGADVVLSLCKGDVPCGKYADQAFEHAGLEVPPAGEEDSVKGVLTKVMLGEADAGLVYVTDVLAATGVEGVDLAASQMVRATYPAAVLTDAPNPAAAAAFVAFLTGDEAQVILETYGFGRP